MWWHLAMLLILIQSYDMNMPNLYTSSDKKLNSKGWYVQNEKIVCLTDGRNIRLHLLYMFERRMLTYTTSRIKYIILGDEYLATGSMNSCCFYWVSVVDYSNSSKCVYIVLMTSVIANSCFFPFFFPFILHSFRHFTYFYIIWMYNLKTASLYIFTQFYWYVIKSLESGLKQNCSSSYSFLLGFRYLSNF